MSTGNNPKITPTIGPDEPVAIEYKAQPDHKLWLGRLYLPDNPKPVVRSGFRAKPLNPSKRPPKKRK